MDKKSKARRKRATKTSNEEREVQLDLPRLHGMIEALMTHLEMGELKGKASVSDLVRLLQLYKELSEEQIREVEVRWVDPTETDGETGE